VHAYLDAPPLALAHRGGAGVPDNVGIENSVAAFAHAYRMGYRYFETDVRLSADGVVFAVHDETLERLTGSTRAVADMTAAQLRSELLDGREPLVSLDDLMDEFGDAKFNVDVKSDDVVEPMCQLVKRRGAFDSACLASFSAARLKQIRAFEPQIATSAGPAEVAAFRLLPGFAARRIASAPVALQVPERRGPITVVTRGFVQRAHAAGVQVHVWTVDDEASIERLLDLGVDGIVSDRTDILKQVLVRRGVWKDPS
jgi:glycerophosphoryl diester phosphodiesterase